MHRKHKLEVEYLSEEHLRGFESYKYSSLDTSPLSVYVMHPFWDKLVQYCPTWIAPNVLTFAGFLFTVLNFILFASYDYYFYAFTDDKPQYPPIPRWVFAIAAFNIFMAYTLDGIDGKQARRTQSSGPLGELFDHGLDSWTAMLITVCMYSVFGRTDYGISLLRMYFVLWNVFVNFYLSHWEKYNTGVLFLPWGYDASMLGTVIIFTLTSIGGHEAWKFKLPGDISAGVMFEMLFYVSALVSNLPVVIWNIYKSYRDKTGKMRTFPEAIRPLVPLCILFAISTIWVVHSPSNIIEKDPRIIYFAIGTIFSNICCRLIVSQMSNTRCEVLPWILLPVTMAAVFSFILPNVDLKSMYLVSVIALLAHVHYGTCVLDGKTYVGQGLSKPLARQNAAENALKALLLEKMTAASMKARIDAESDGQANSSTEGIKEENTDDTSTDVNAEDEIPWSSLASFALYKLFLDWHNQGTSVPVPRPGLPATKGAKKENPNSPKVPVQKELPPNPINIHPVMLLNQMRPGLTYVEVSRIGNPPNTMFTLAVEVDGVNYSGTGIHKLHEAIILNPKNKKDAKKAAAKAALLALYGLTYPEDNPKQENMVLD